MYEELPLISLDQLPSDQVYTSQHIPLRKISTSQDMENMDVKKEVQVAAIQDPIDTYDDSELAEDIDDIDIDSLSENDQSLLDDSDEDDSDESGDLEEDSDVDEDGFDYDLDSDE